MAVSAFTPFHENDVVVAFGLQSAYGTAASLTRKILARRISINPLSVPMVGIGTTNYRGVLKNQEAHSSRLALIDLDIELVNNDAVKDVFTWMMGDTNKLGNQVKFITIGLRLSSNKGIGIQDVAVSSFAVVFAQDDIGVIAIEAQSFADWTTTGGPTTGNPSAGIPTVIDDLSMTWNSVEYPCESLSIYVDKQVKPIYGNNSYPISYQSMNFRRAYMAVEFSPTEPIYDLTTAMKDDTSSDIVISSSLGGFSAALRNAKIMDTAPPEFDDGLIQPMITTFCGFATDTSTPELAMALA